MDLLFEQQVFAALALVTHWVKCAAVENPVRSRTYRRCWESTAVFRFMEIGAFARHVFHIPRIRQTRLDSVPLHRVINRNPIRPGGLHGCPSDAATHQPRGHLVEIPGKGPARADGMVIPVRWHGHEDLSGSDIDAGAFGSNTDACVPSFLWPAFLFLATSSTDWSGAADCSFIFDITPLRPGKGQAAHRERSFDRNQSGRCPDCNRCLLHGAWEHAFNRVFKHH